MFRWPALAGARGMTKFGLGGIASLQGRGGSKASLERSQEPGSSGVISSTPKIPGISGTPLSKRALNVCPGPGVRIDAASPPRGDSRVMLRGLQPTIRRWQVKRDKYFIFEFFLRHFQYLLPSTLTFLCSTSTSSWMRMVPITLANVRWVGR